jgi:hypothetical protein
MSTKVKFLKDHGDHKQGQEAELDISLADPLEENGVVEFVASEPEPVEHAASAEPKAPKAKSHK